MITCSPDKQIRFLEALKKYRIIDEQSIIKAARSYLGVTDLEKLSDLISLFSEERGNLIDYLKIVGITIAEDKEGKISTKGPKKPLSPSNVSPNFIAANVDLLFTELHVAHLFFKREVKSKVLSAAYLGPKHKKGYTADSEITENLNLLKNDLFNQILDYLVSQNILKKEDYFEEVTIGGNTITKPLGQLFDSRGFNSKYYKNNYKKVMDLLENNLLSNTDLTISVPNSDQKIPAIKGSLEDPISRKRYEVYNAAILLLNFDTVILNEFDKMLGVDKSTFNAFESPINNTKYFRKVKGIETTYFKEDGTESGGVEEYEDKLSHSLVSMIPIYSSDEELTTQFMEMRDLYGLGAALNDFQTKNFLMLSKLKGWTTLEEDPIRMLNWYVDRISEAYDKNFISTSKTKDNLDSDFWEEFRSKVNIVKSLQKFLEVIKVKEENSINFSMARIITQPLINSIGAVYSTDGVDKHWRSYKEMHSQNFERIQIQESVYGHLRNSLSNWYKVHYSKSDLKEVLKDLNPHSLRTVISNITGIYLDNKAINTLIEKWSDKPGVSRALTYEEKVDAVVGKILEMVSKIFLKEKAVKAPSKEDPSKLVETTEGVFENSIFEKISENESKIDEITSDDVTTANTIISDLTSTKALMDIIDEKLKSVKAVVITKVSKKDGKPIPTSIIPSLGFNDSALLLERSRLEKSSKDRLYKNYFVNNGGLNGTVIRLESLNREDSKDSALLNVVENFTSHFEFDFLESMKPNSEKKIDDVNIMIGNYADKSRILDKRVSSKASLNGKHIIKSSSTEIDKSKANDVMNAEEVWENSRKQSLNYYTDLTKDIIRTFSEMFPDLTSKEDLNTPEYFLKVVNDKSEVDYEKIKNILKEVNRRIQNMDYDSFLRYTNSLKGNFVKELHYSVYRVGKEFKVALNQTILDYLDIYSNPLIFKKFVERQKESFLYKLLDYKPNEILITSKVAAKLFSGKKGYDENVLKSILHSLGYSYEDYKKNFMKNIPVERTDEDIEEGLTEDSVDLAESQDHILYTMVKGELVLNPLVDKWLAVNEFFRNEYLYMSVKPEYMHPAKFLEDRSKNTTVDQFLDSFSKESGLRLTGMAKRNVSMTGSTELPSRRSRFGTPDDVNVVVIDDHNSKIPLLSGQVISLSVHDGSSLLSYSYSKMIDNSYQGKGMQGAKKQLGTFVTEFGSALKKDAESIISNANIRNSSRSPINLRNKQFQTHSIPIYIDYFDSGTLRSDNRFFKNGEYYAINSYVIKNNEFSYTLSKYNQETKLWESLGNQNPVIINSLFDIWELFGGEYSVDENFEFNEGSNESVYSLVTSYQITEDSPFLKALAEQATFGEEGDPDVEEAYKELERISSNNGYILKSKMIHIISNHSSFKSGASNLHTADYWRNAERLKHTTYRNRHMGVQLDATHEIVDSRIKEVTQMVSSLSQNPDTAEQAERMYETLADIIKESIRKTYNKGDITKGKDLDTLYKTLSKSLVRSLNKSANVGLAKTIAQTFEHQELLPFSNQNFFRNFIQDLVVRMNRDFITRYYPGSGGILTASHGMITVLENHKGEVFTQSDVKELAIKDYVKNKSLYAVGLTTEQIIDAYVDRNFGDEDVDVGELQLLDSVVVDGEVHNLDTIEKYYDFKNKYEGQLVKKSRKSFRDLKPIEISFSSERNVMNNEGLLERRIVKRTLWDSIPMKLKFLKDYSTPELLNVMEQFKKHFSIDDSTVEGKRLLNLKLNLWLHRENQMLSKKRSLYDVTDPQFSTDGVIDFTTYFGEDNLSSIVVENYEDHYNRISSEVLTYNKRAAELIMGNIYSDVFNTGKDNIGFIRSKGSEYFKDKIKEFYNYSKSFKSDFKISTKDRDVYVKFVPKGELPQVAASKLKGFVVDEFEDDGTLKKIRLNSVGESLYELPTSSVVNILPEYDILYIESGERQTVFQEEKVKDSVESTTERSVKEEVKKEGKYVKKFIPYKNINYIMDNLLKSFDSEIQAIVPIMSNYITDETKVPHSFNKQVYELFKVYSGYTPKNYESFNNYLENYLDSILDQVSNRMYVSWEKSLEFIASRIPAQSMQSFMEMKNVGYFNTNNNEIYVSVWQIVIQGSDFDIDKAYLMGNGFNKMGHYEVATDAFKFDSKETIEAIENLPKPTKKSIKLVTNTEGIVDISSEFNEFVQSIENISDQIDSDGSLEAWLEKIDEIEEFSDYELSRGLNLSVKTIEIVGKILNKLKNWEKANINYVYNPLVKKEYQDEVFDNYRKVLNRLVNIHNTSKKYTKNRFSQINANISSIRKIISDPSNQLWANSPVTIEAFHEGADEVSVEKEKRISSQINNILETFKSDEKLSSIKNVSELLNIINRLYNVKVIKPVVTLGEYIQEAKRINLIKNTLSGHDMISMFKQQSDAIIGRKDVGIGANGIKVLFALNSYYNKYFKSLSVSHNGDLVSSKGIIDIMKDPKWFKKILHMGGKLGTVTRTAVADVWMDEKLKNTIAIKLGLTEQEKLLNIIQSGMAAVYISGFISGATDNAKELIMAKINAINELASMHLYLMILGFSAQEVAGYMTSDLANFVVSKINSSNIYEDAKGMRVDNIIKKYKELNPTNTELADTFLDIHEAAQEISNLAAFLKINQSTSADITSMFLFLNRFNKAMYTRENAVLGNDVWKLTSEDHFEEAVKKIVEKNPTLSEEYVKDVLLRASDINVETVDERGQRVTKTTSLLGGGFDFRYYIEYNNGDYRKMAVEYYNLFKNTINIFDVIEESTHFKAMIEGLSEVHTNAMTVSKKYNFVFNTTLDVVREKSSEIRNNNQKTIKNYLGNPKFGIDLDERAISKLLRGFDGFVIAAWSKTSDLKNYQLSVQTLLKQIGLKKFEGYVDNNAKTQAVGKSAPGIVTVLAESGDDLIVDLTTDFGIANFKKIMEELIFPILKKSQSSQLGSLLRLKSIRNPYGLISPQITPSFAISSLNNDVNITKYQALLHEFNQVDFAIEKSNRIVNKDGSELKYKDLFYLYNLIVNNEQYGDHRLTPIFQDYVKNRNSIAYKYLSFSREVDLRKIDIFETGVDPILEDGSKNVIYDKLLHSFKNDVIFIAFNKKGVVNVKSQDNGVSHQIAVRNPHFVINTYADVSANIDIEKYTQYATIWSILNNSNLLINFKCD